jgi:hypothetical protein
MKLPVSREHPEIPYLVISHSVHPPFGVKRFMAIDFMSSHLSTIFHQAGGPELLVDCNEPDIDRGVAALMADELVDSPERIDLIKRLLDPQRIFTRGYKFSRSLGFSPMERTRAGVTRPILERIISRPDWIKKHPELIDWVLEFDDLDLTKEIAGKVISSPEALHHFEWITKILNGSDDGYLKRTLFKSLSNSQWFPRYKEILLRLKSADRLLYYNALLSNPEFLQQRPDDIRAIIALNNAEMNSLIASKVLSQRVATDHADWFKNLYLNMRATKQWEILTALKNPQWAETHPELVSFVIRNGCDLDLLDKTVLSEPSWKKSESLRKLTFFRTPTARLLKNRLDQGKEVPQVSSEPLTSSSAFLRCLIKNLIQ